MKAVRRFLPAAHAHLYEGLFAATLCGLVAGVIAYRAGAPGLARTIWLVVTAAACVPAIWWTADRLLRRRLGSDAIAVAALVGALAVEEYLAGAVVGVMLTGGQLLEYRASRRARRDLGALLSMAPRTAHRYEDGGVVTVDVHAVHPGELLVVRPGDMVPVDGIVDRGPATLDESTITGESLPVERATGDAVRGGAVNSGSPFGLRATTDYDSSTYAGIVQLSRAAAAGSARFVRLADRYAAFFLPVTFALAAAAWLASDDPVRAVAVLVVATPCPLILAAPIAFVSGLSRCARRGVVVKGGDVLERLARSRVLLFDKTGTVTTGRPALVDIKVDTRIPPDELLALAASLDQVSPHVLASAIVQAARNRDLALRVPKDVVEEPGQGIRGRVGGRLVSVGKAAWAAASDTGRGWSEQVRDHAAAVGAITVFVGVDGVLAGVLLLQDRVRPDAGHTLRMLRWAGIDRTVMITGDRAAVARPIADLVGADEIHAEQTPAGKVAIVRAESERTATVMVGDGINDAPALATAGAGVALGARGATVSAEAADVVIVVDRLERLGEAMAIARRTHRVARQSVVAGMGLSIAAMLVAAAGGLAPVFGALLQEGIDVAVILNALRALGQGPGRWPRLTGADAELVRRLDTEHRRLWPRIQQLPRIADSLTDMPPEQLCHELGTLVTFLSTELADHERTDEQSLYPAIARALGGADPTGAMSRGHAEIAELTRNIDLLSTEVRDRRAAPETLRDLRGAIYELYAVLRLHFAQEEENYFVLADEPGRDGS